MLLASFAFLLFLFTMLTSGPAVAAECDITPSTLQFGAVDTLAEGSTPSTTTEISINCTEVAQEQVSMCLYARSEGPDSGDSRVLTSSSGGQLTYRLFTGNRQGWPDGQASVISLEAQAGGIAEGTIIVTGEIDAGQSETPAGTYAGTIFVSGGYQEGAASCAAMSGVLEDKALNVAANIEPNCNVEAEDISFGAVTSLSSVPDVNGGLRINCTPGANYSITLSGGNNWQNGQRHMIGGQRGGLVAYDLLTDGTAWGLEQQPYDPLDELVPITGRIPNQDLQPVDSYHDTVVVTLFYNGD